eukprot:TRINITY_DN3309_c0_g1_i1.p1 TRINITY_DN3309_c0_g1~~TRINITY_DN3309_c0_g1_i1.p1  ORF type:complete len:656 (-),score=191.38 TRINITY_DN3309_c0_g1_i1:101-2020(-)
MSTAKITICAVLAVVCCIALAAEPLQKHSFQGPFDQSSATELPNWMMSGDAILTDMGVRLTPALESRSGSVWNVERVNAGNWVVTFEFRIHGGRSTGADGMAFWYVQKPEERGPVFGHSESWNGLGVFIDTFDNDGRRNNPYVSVIISDGSARFDHGSDNQGKSAVAGCVVKDLRNPRGNSKMKIVYDHNVLQVLVDSQNEGQWTTCVTVDSADLPRGYHFGLSAATGSVADNHDVMNFVAEQLEKSEDEQEPQPEGAIETLRQRLRRTRRQRYLNKMRDKTLEKQGALSGGDTAVVEEQPEEDNTLTSAQATEIQRQQEADQQARELAEQQALQAQQAQREAEQAAVAAAVDPVDAQQKQLDEKERQLKEQQAKLEKEKADFEAARKQKLAETIAAQEAKRQEQQQSEQQAPGTTDEAVESLRAQVRDLTAELGQMKHFLQDMKESLSLQISSSASAASNGAPVSADTSALSQDVHAVAEDVRNVKSELAAVRRDVAVAAEITRQAAAASSANTNGGGAQSVETVQKLDTLQQAVRVIQDRVGDGKAVMTVLDELRVNLQALKQLQHPQAQQQQQQPAAPNQQRYVPPPPPVLNDFNKPSEGSYFWIFVGVAAIFVVVIVAVGIMWKRARDSRRRKLF